MWVKQLKELKPRSLDYNVLKVKIQLRNIEQKNIDWMIHRKWLIKHKVDIDDYEEEI